MFLLDFSISTPSYIESAVPAAAIRTELPAVFDADPVRPGDFPAALAEMGIKDLRFLGEPERGGLYLKQLLV